MVFIDFPPDDVFAEVSPLTALFMFACNSAGVGTPFFQYHSYKQRISYYSLSNQGFQKPTCNQLQSIARLSWLMHIACRRLEIAIALAENPKF